jgi:sucrose-6F-phosphate phosphohydrolase
MQKINKEPELVLNVLATDLDGTLIPLPDSPEHETALSILRDARNSHPFTFLYATGRHYESVQEAIESYNLPLPDWIVCDVGTSIYSKSEGNFVPFQPYIDHLNSLTQKTDREQVLNLLSDLEGLELQCEAHQQEFKISYQCTTERMEALVEAVDARLRAQKIPFDVTGSVDPFLHCGLIDLLPTGTSKAYAVQWLATHADFSPESVLYAGDSGNDFSALTCGFRAIVVANAGETLTKKVMKALAQKGMQDRAYAAQHAATQGVLEGCRHFGLLPE